MTAMTTATYTVAGMTCGHCVSAVTQEITALEGVTAVEIDLVPGGDSRVTVTGTAPLAESAVRAAVEEAGYDLAGVTLMSTLDGTGRGHDAAEPGTAEQPIAAVAAGVAAPRGRTGTGSGR